MYYFDLKDGSMRLGFGSPETIVANGLSQHGDNLIGIYQDNENNPFIPIWQRSTQMRVREYVSINNGYHQIDIPLFVASKFEQPLDRDKDNTLVVCFCVPGPRDYIDATKEEAIKLLSKRFATGHRSVRKINVTSDIIQTKGAIESLVRALVVDTIVKDKSLVTSNWHHAIYKMSRW
jgi:hypothetical protein